MDEVDGMSSGDIGGTTALVKIIKDTRNPLICVCNDRYCQKLKPLTVSCADIRFYKPLKNAVAKRLLEISRIERIKADLPALELLAESVNCDIRSALNLLQMQARNRGAEAAIPASLRLANFSKDSQVAMNAFEVSKDVNHSLLEELYPPSR